MVATLTAKERTAVLRKLRGWKTTDGGKAISRVFTFADFNAAFGFMTQAALVAAKMDHHPDWSNAYKTVTVTLSTHEAGGLTERDVTLAKAMNSIAAGA